MQLGPGYRVAGFSLLGLQLALVLRGIAHAHAMFGDFARGEVLTSATARRLRGIALLITLFALCSPLVKMLLVLLFTWSAPGEPHMLIHIQLEDILLGLLGGLLFALAWAMEEAAHVAEETGVHLMAIVVRLDVVLAQRKMKARQLAQEIGITEPNLSLLKSGRSRASASIRWPASAKCCSASPAICWSTCRTRPLAWPRRTPASISASTDSPVSQRRPRMHEAWRGGFTPLRWMIIMQSPQCRRHVRSLILLLSACARAGRSSVRITHNEPGKGCAFLGDVTGSQGDFLRARSRPMPTWRRALAMT